MATSLSGDQVTSHRLRLEPLHLLIDPFLHVLQAKYNICLTSIYLTNKSRLRYHNLSSWLESKISERFAR